MSSVVKILLLRSTKGLGKLGEECSVKLGYARNYLIPKGIALTSNIPNRKFFESIRKREEKKSAEERKDAEKIQKKLEGKQIEIAQRTHDKGKLYGAISVANIVALIDAQLKVPVEKRAISMAEAVKEVGEYEVVVSLPQEVVARLKLVVSSEGEDIETVEEVAEEADVDEGATDDVSEAQTEAASEEPVSSETEEEISAELEG